MEGARAYRPAPGGGGRRGHTSCSAFAWSKKALCFSQPSMQTEPISAATQERIHYHSTLPTSAPAADAPMAPIHQGCPDQSTPQHPPPHSQVRLLFRTSMNIDADTSTSSTLNKFRKPKVAIFVRPCIQESFLLHSCMSWLACTLSPALALVCTWHCSGFAQTRWAAGLTSSPSHLLLYHHTAANAPGV